ncbi:large conductance mechanosensitive channel protein MscL [Lactococcus petauri]|uniref:large conductance mechanosensitive channel protein MscL n=1 Tax=Lactococcus petauri TaxID=1940789 RepID=UPI0018AC013C|nr:large conductance mechanosensitive channel protein MscL [Lactococcus petauri]MDC0827079.1 large conductance mechanosensitive channel protein MscL [Lactococcus petauri]
MFKEFKDFIAKGDVLDLAVGVVIGGAFTAIVNGIVKGLITPLIALVLVTFTGEKDLNGAMSILDWTPVTGVTFALGDVVSAIITFMITGFVLFLIVKVANRAKAIALKEEAVEAVVTSEDYLKRIVEILEKEKK